MPAGSIATRSGSDPDHGARDRCHHHRTARVPATEAAAKTPLLRTPLVKFNRCRAPLNQLRTHMDVVKDLCTVIPVVVLTAAAVLGVATVISLSSWALL